MLEIVDLTVAYGPVVALERVSFTVAAGSVTAVLGANGNISRFILVEDLCFAVHDDASSTAHHDPMFSAMMMSL